MPPAARTGDGRGPALREVVAVMLRLGATAFGGPAVHVAMLREEAVRRRRWLDDREFLDLFGAVSVLPGPSSTQLAIVLSRRRAGWAGLLLGGACFIAPAMAIVLALAWAYVRYRATTAGAGVLYGVGPVVVAIAGVAVVGLARTAMTHRWFVVILGVSVAAYFGGVNVLLPLLGGGLAASLVANGDRIAGAHAVLPLVTALPTVVHARVRPSALDVLAEFGKLGVVVFGSGYVLLAFLRADLVDHLHWLTQQQLLDAVAAGQVTPGPVFTTATFVGYLLGGVPVALIATAGIFVPSFVMVAVAEPLVARVRRSPWLAPALDGVTVAALGLMAGVTVDLGRTAVTDPLTIVTAVAALAALLRWKRSSIWLVLAGAVIGVAHAAVH